MGNGGGDGRGDIFGAVRRSPRSIIIPVYSFGPPPRIFFLPNSCFLSQGLSAFLICFERLPVAYLRGYLLFLSASGDSPFLISGAICFSYLLHFWPRCAIPTGSWRWRGRRTFISVRLFPAPSPCVCVWSTTASQTSSFFLSSNDETLRESKRIPLAPPLHPHPPFSCRLQFVFIGDDKGGIRQRRWALLPSPLAPFSLGSLRKTLYKRWKPT
jgi:hypothetical protein